MLLDVWDYAKHHGEQTTLGNEINLISRKSYYFWSIIRQTTRRSTALLGRLPQVSAQQRGPAVLQGTIGCVVNHARSP